MNDKLLEIIHHRNGDLPRKIRRHDSGKILLSFGVLWKPENYEIALQLFISFHNLMNKNHALHVHKDIFIKTEFHFNVA